MMEFNEPPPVLLKQPPLNGQEQPLLTYYFGKNYLMEIIFARPYWRTEKGAEQAEEIIEQVDREVKTYVLRGGTHEALQKDLMLAGELVQNPALVRPSIRFKRVVDGARKHVEAPPPPPKVEANGSAESEA